MYLQKGITYNNLKEKVIFSWLLKGHGQKEQKSHPDPLVTSTGPRFRILIRIRTKMSQIPNTEFIPEQIR